MEESVAIIIGAGANKEINPSADLGIDLINNIANRVTDRTSLNDKYLSSNISKNIPHLTEQVRENFLIHLDNYLSSSKPPSIDGFLDEIDTYPEFEKDKKNYLELGRLLIISHVLGWEGKTTQDNIKTEIESKKTWLSVLANWIEDNRILTDKRQLNHLKIATFNYDRILEYFLFEKFGDVARDFVFSNIHHVYGRIGRLKQFRTASRNKAIVEMGHPPHDFENIKQLTNNIRLVNDRSNQNPTATWKHFEFDSRHKVIIFGYGLDPVNNRRLRFEKFDRQHDQNFIFNCYPGPFPNYDFDYRREVAEKVRAIKIDADIQYNTSTNFLKYALGKKYIDPQ